MNRLFKPFAIFASFILLFTMLVYDFSASVEAAQASAQPKPAARSKTELLIKYKDETKSQSTMTNVRNKLKLGKLETKRKGRLSHIDLLDIGDSDNLNQTITELKKDPNVEYVQPNYVLSATSISDPRFDEQWGLSNTGQTIGSQDGLSGVDIGAEAAWKVTTGAPSVLVGVLDTGIDIAHPDLQPNMYTNTAEIADNGIDDDGNGYVDDVQGYDFVNHDASVYDSAADDKHGTHVAGIIAAAANDQGIRGVAPDVKILPLKFITGGVGYTSDAIEAIEYAQRMGVSVINMSFGGPDDNQALHDALAQSGILFVAAAGNQGQNEDNNPFYPAAYDLPNELSVAAMDNQSKLASFSDFGSAVDVAAPGVAILSTQPEGTYGYLSGTSMAAPFVTGIAALLKSKFPDITAQEIVQRVKNGVSDDPNLFHKVSTNGFVDATAALNGSASPVTTPSEPAKTSTDKTESNGKGSMVVSLAATVSANLLEQIHYGEEGVNVATGNYGKTVTDMSIESPGFTVNISRTYNSKDSRATSTLGRGWTFGFEGSVKDDTTSPTQFKVATLPNGSAEVFVKNADGTYTANDSHSTLVKNADGTHTLTTKDQYSYGFNTSGFLVWMQDRNGNRVTIDVDGNGKVRKITDTVDRVFTVNYNASGYITSIKDPIGRTVTYSYDSKNLLSQVTDPMGTVVSKYSYDTSNYLTTIQDGDGNVLESALYDHATGTNQNKVSRYTNIYGNTSLFTYDTTNSKTTIKDLAGLTMVKWYDTAGFVTKSQDPEGRTSQVDYFLDANNFNKYGEEKAITDRYGNKTQYDRDNNGNITKITNPDGSSRVYTYDDRNNELSEADETGRTTYFVYDSAKVKLLKKIQPLNGTDVYSAGADDSKFAITTYRYVSDADAARLGYKAKGLLQSESDPEGGVTSYAYDAQGNKIAVTNPVGSITHYEYNGVSWLTSQLSAEGYRTDYTYDLAGRLVRTVLDQGETSFTEYDALGNKIQIVKANQYNAADDGLNDSTPTYAYRNSDIGERLTYYPNGLVKTDTDALGNVTKYTYDVYGNVATETKPNESVTTYQYDVMNRLKKKSFQPTADAVAVTLETDKYTVLSGGLSQQSQTVYFSDTALSTTTTTYDTLGRPATVQQADGTSLETAYFANGTVKSSTDARGNTTVFRYDGLNRLTDTWSPLDGGKYTYKGTVYDRAGRTIETLTGKDPASLGIAPAEDRTMWSKTSYNADDTVLATTDSTGAHTEFLYDDDGRMIRQEASATEKETLAIDYEYNELSKPVKMTQHVRSGDLVGNDFTDDTDTALVTTYSYDQEGNLTSKVTPDGVETQMTYDVLGRLLTTSNEGQDETGSPRSSRRPLRMTGPGMR